VVLGAAAVDWVARVAELPRPDGISWAESYAAYPGGSGGNIAAALGRLGQIALFVGRLGDDEGGRLLLEDFKDAGVNLEGIRVMAGQRSASCFIAVDEHGARQMIALGGTALVDKPDELDPDWFAGARALVVADAFPEVALTAAGYCPPEVQVISCPGGLMISQAEKLLDPLLASRPVLVVSRGEACQLAECTRPAAAIHSLIKKGFPAVIVTLAEQGVLFGWDNRILSMPARPVSRVVDATGAGDAFTAGFTAGILMEMDMPLAVHAGLCTAAGKIGQAGARSGIPGREEFTRLVNEEPMRIEEVIV